MTPSPHTCEYCGGTIHCSDESFRENPYCDSCLEERLGNAHVKWVDCGDGWAEPVPLGPDDALDLTHGRPLVLRNRDEG